MIPAEWVALGILIVCGAGLYLAANISHEDE
jgi:hypothetical protein